MKKYYLLFSNGERIDTLLCNSLESAQKAMADSYNRFALKKIQKGNFSNETNATLYACENVLNRNLCWRIEIVDIPNCKVMEVKTPNGVIRATETTDPNYPGVDIEYISTSEDFYNREFLSRPRVLVEYCKEDKQLRAAIWSDEYSEDYFESIEFNQNYYLSK